MLTDQQLKEIGSHSKPAPKPPTIVERCLLAFIFGSALAFWVIVYALLCWKFYNHY